MCKYDELVSKYKEFVYRGFDYKIIDNILKINLFYEILGLEEFNHYIEIPVLDNNLDGNCIKKLVFNIGLVEMLSYWKITCSKKIVIKCGKLDNYQISWFKKLMINGLGEFFYRNNIILPDDFVSIVSLGEEIYECSFSEDVDGYLTLVGGGKDSLTSLELIKQKENKKVLIFNNRKICYDGAIVAGYKPEDIICVKRVFDKKIIELNNRGFLNGHIPISASFAFISYLVAYLYNMKFIVLSNESSANEVSVKGTNVNHQYSKSYEFERDFDEYTKKYFSKDINYFSLLRPLNELQIISIFTKFPKYFNVFISCNDGSKRKNIGISDGWCLNCAKCLFIYILMSYFLSKETMIEIFGEDLLDKESMLDDFKDLIGITESKPFECVGMVDEVNFVLQQKLEQEDLPYLLRYYKERCNVPIVKHNPLQSFNEENNVPIDLIDIVRRNLND